MAELMTEHPVLSEPRPVLEHQEAEVRYDALCLWYFGRELHDHSTVRRRVLGLLTDTACLNWPWSCVLAHCGLSSDFVTLVAEGLQGGVDAAMVRAEDEGRGSLVLVRQVDTAADEEESDGYDRVQRTIRATDAL